MDLISLVLNVIIGMTILTLVFGVIAYYIYKLRKKKSTKRVSTDYEAKCIELGADYIFFDKYKKK